MSTQKLVHYHAPQTRSFAILWLFEELGSPPHELKVLNLKKGEHKSPAYRAINPMGKVPAIVHGDTVVTEAAAIALYLADAFPDAELAPKIGDPARGTYLAVDCFQSGRRRAGAYRFCPEARARSGIDALLRLV